MKIMKTLVCFGLLLSLVLPTFSMTAKELLKEIDKNYDFKTQEAVNTMIIHTLRGSRTITARTQSEGSDTSFTEYLSPQREKGTKMLKVKNNLWTYVPMADRVIKISGHMLKQSVMGSDLSYEDFLEQGSLEDDYKAQIVGKEIVRDRECYLVKLVAKHNEVAYPTRHIWVDKDRFLGLKEHRYGKSGTLLKTTEITEVFQVEGRWYPKRILFKDVLKQGGGTEVIIEDIKFNQTIPKHVFSKASLRR